MSLHHHRSHPTHLSAHAISRVAQTDNTLRADMFSHVRDGGIGATHVCSPGGIKLTVIHPRRSHPGLSNNRLWQTAYTSYQWDKSIRMWKCTSQGSMVRQESTQLATMETPVTHAHNTRTARRRNKRRSRAARKPRCAFLRFHQDTACQIPWSSLETEHPRGGHEKSPIADEHWQVDTPSFGDSPGLINMLD